MLRYNDIPEGRRFFEKCGRYFGSGKAFVQLVNVKIVTENVRFLHSGRPMKVLERNGLLD